MAIIASSFAEVNADLLRIVQEKETKGGEVVTAMEAWNIAEAEYENANARYLLEEKAKNTKLTMGEAVALATNLSHALRLDAIRAESTYRKLKNELEIINNRLDVCREISFNLRQEAKI